MLGTRGLVDTRRIGWASTENLADSVRVAGGRRLAFPGLPRASGVSPAEAHRDGNLH